MKRHKKNKHKAGDQLDGFAELGKTLTDDRKKHLKAKVGKKNFK